MLTNEVLAQTQQLICEFANVEHNVMVTLMPAMYETFM
jgi:hypothetical protein